MQRCFKAFLPAAVLILVAMLPAQAAAQAEVSPFAGYLFGSNIDPESPPGTGGVGPAIPRNFEDSFTWGVRGGYFFEGNENIGVEGNFTQSPFANFIVGGQQLDARATYADVNLVVQSSGARARFYGTAGLGMVRFRMGASEGGQTHTKLGVNFGVGVKVPMWTARYGDWGLRFDVRDHWHRMEADDSMRSNFRNALQLPSNSSSQIHNVVTTVGLYFVFD